MSLGPNSHIVWEHIESEHHFQVEQLAEPRQVGAGLRYFRLYHNREPAFGGQWHYTLAEAKKRAEYLLEGEYLGKIRWLEQRVVELERELRKYKYTGEEKWQKN